jgi:hypothetical protein
MTTFGFKAKTIKKVLNRKIKDWIESIDDPALKKLLCSNTIVTGGSITSMLMGDEIKDFDVYFKDKETTIAVSKYYCGVFLKQNPKYASSPPITEVDDNGRVTIHIASAGVAESDDAKSTPEEAYEHHLSEGAADSIEDELSNDEDKPKYRPVFMSPNAITLTNKVQLVIRFYGSAEEIHKNYDYFHCMNVYDYASGELSLLPRAMESILSKTLVYTGSLYPICSLFRMRKFLDRGWRISAGEIVKMAFQISELNLKDVNVLKEQLTGVDQAYMRHLIYEVESFKKDNPDKDIDSLYIVGLVDKIFND